jgi:hypothetical protein
VALLATALSLAVTSNLDTRVRIAAVIATALMLGVVLELVRRRRLVERYALLWMVVALALLVLAIWNDVLGVAADLLGIAVPSNALFLAAFGVAFFLLLHFSVITSRLSEETKILAQEVARLGEELQATRAMAADGDQGARERAERVAGSEAHPRAPSSASTTDQ